MMYKNKMKLSENFIIRKIGDETTIIPLVRELGHDAHLYTLNKTSSEILDLVKEGENEDKIAFSMKKLYPHAEDLTLKEDIRETINDFKSIGLITQV
jgi:hypothetical protein